MLKRNFREWSIVAALLVLCLVLALLAPAFFQKRQLLTVLTTAMPVLLVASGMSLVIICRQIDISVGSQFAVCSVMLGLMAQAHWPIVLAGIATVFVGAILGTVNGLLVAYVRLPSIVVTLATLVTWRESLRWWRQGEFVRDLPEGFQWFGLGQSLGQAVLLICSGILFLLIAAGMKRLSAGRYLYAVGSDSEAARLAGINAEAVTFAAFVVMGALTAFAALLNGVRFADVDPKTGTGLELQVIAATVVGGVAISGGRGNLWGVLAGVLLLACVAPGLVFLKFQPQWEKAIQGLIILLAVAADGWRTSRMRTQRSPLQS